MHMSKRWILCTFYSRGFFPRGAAAYVMYTDVISKRWILSTFELRGFFPRRAAAYVILWYDSSDVS